MSEDNDDSSKTEEPTQKRLEEAFKKGQVVNSREVTNFFLLFTFTLIIAWGGPHIAGETLDNFTSLLSQPEIFETDPASIGHVLTGSIRHLALMLVAPLLALVAAAITASLLQNPFHIALDQISPKFERVSPIKGLGRLFSKRNLVEFLKNLIKLSMVGAVGFWAVWPNIDHVAQTVDMDIASAMGFTLAMVKRLMIGICIIMFCLAASDYLYQRFSFIKSMRMSKQEIKEEYKQQEGDPHIKQRLRRLRMERARKRMMAAVPASDVVITNPTHFAVALKYDANTMAAPVVVAKGADNIAAKIREIAEANNIPIVQNPPVARALYDTAKLDEEIPLAHYKAVAEIIGYVYRLRGKVNLRGRP